MVRWSDVAWLRWAAGVGEARSPVIAMTVSYQHNAAPSRGTATGPAQTQSPPVWLYLNSVRLSGGGGLLSACRRCRSSLSSGAEKEGRAVISALAAAAAAPCLWQCSWATDTQPANSGAVSPHVSLQESGSSCAARRLRQEGLRALSSLRTLVRRPAECGAPAARPGGCRPRVAPQSCDRRRRPRAVPEARGDHTALPRAARDSSPGVKGAEKKNKTKRKKNPIQNRCMYLI